MGATTTVQVNTLTNRPSRSNFRPIIVIAEISAPYVPATDSRPGFYAPGGVQLDFHRPEGGEVQATSRLMALSDKPKVVKLRYPRSGDWFSYNSAPAAPVLDITSVCLGAAGATAYMRGTLRIIFSASPEVNASACPTLLVSPDQLLDHGVIVE